MSNQAEFYQELLGQTKALISNESDIIANMANVSALLFERLAEVNWVGFYRLVGDELVLGPFQGKVACLRIPLGQGVCGTCALTGEVQRIADVHQFDGHIACDASSNAELVVPVKVAGKVVAILDIDSTALARFDQQDEQGIMSIVKIFEQNITAQNDTKR
ncbi:MULTISPECIES: GAF domain-containing protein [Colwellia]|uniref:Free methionine-R-sulfoxide reductase YebR n=1 Tax=Colwellia marinimaniae TaxID=1513592 RepID=A0ABQ0MV18_9GAMM|nr:MULTISPECIES: GAF domain-containing protein [Colwellia]GAW96213.1 free methionine-R-sulfoxide reductase YebR [Colwellia marinimaniae]